MHDSLVCFEDGMIVLIPMHGRSDMGMRLHANIMVTVLLKKTVHYGGILISCKSCLVHSLTG